MSDTAMGKEGLILPDFSALEIIYVLKPRGGTDTGMMSQNFGLTPGEMPKYALVCNFRISNEMFNIGRSCDSTILPLESLTITDALMTCKQFLIVRY